GDDAPPLRLRPRELLAQPVERRTRLVALRARPDEVRAGLGLCGDRRVARLLGEARALERLPHIVGAGGEVVGVRGLEGLAEVPLPGGRRLALREPPFQPLDLGAMLGDPAGVPLRHAAIELRPLGACRLELGREARLGLAGCRERGAERLDALDLVTRPLELGLE